VHNDDVNHSGKKRRERRMELQEDERKVERLWRLKKKQVEIRRVFEGRTTRALTLSPVTDVKNEMQKEWLKESLKKSGAWAPQGTALLRAGEREGFGIRLAIKVGRMNLPYVCGGAKIP
jgi:hypothetical protein